MRSEEKAPLVPKLRFPRFLAAGDWTTEKLSSLASIITERVGNAACVPMSVSSGVGLVSQEAKFGRVIAGDSYKNYLRLEPNDFAYNKSATKDYPEGFLALYSGNELAAVPNSIFTCFRVNGKSAVPTYLNYLFLGNLHGKWLRRFIQVGARAHGSLSVNDADLMALPVPLPAGRSSVAEQQRIVDCLTTVDELIAAQARKVDALSRYKFGLLQQLFPSEDEVQPALRFPEFQNQEGWVISSIQELIDKKLLVGHLDGNHGSLYPRAEEFSDSGVPYISAANFKNGEIDFGRCKHLPNERAAQFNKGVARDGDILFAHNATVGPVAKLTTKHDFVILSTSLTYFRCNRALLSNDFLQCALVSPGFVNQCARVMSQSTRNQIPITTQRTFSLQIPTLPEQRRIADCFVALNANITNATQELESLKSHKKGLMQQLFPPAEALDA